MNISVCQRLEICSICEGSEWGFEVPGDSGGSITAMVVVVG